MATNQNESSTSSTDQSASMDLPSDSKSVLKRSLAVVFGVCGGDTLGAPLEKLGRKPKQDELDEVAMMMSGMLYARGQITDDGEMTISLARGLANCTSGFDIEMIALEYANWVDSKPFDMGITIGASIGCVLKGKYNQKFMEHIKSIGYAKAMMNAANFEGKTSKSNGTLMRCSPIGIYGYKLTDDEIAHIAKLDSQLSHPNETVIDAVSCYCIAVAELVASGDFTKAFNRSFNYAKSKCNQEVIGWLTEVEESAKNGTPLPITIQESGGFVKVGFELAFYFLLKPGPYLESMRMIMSYGGDTDTNCAIVGGILGVHDLPDRIVASLINCNTQQGPKPRPDFLHPKNLEDLVTRILEVAPSSIPL